MKYLFLFAITLYQLFISSFLKTILGSSSFCRFTPSCSAYAKQSIKKYGALKGVYLSFIRLLKCQPFANQNSKYNAKIKSFFIFNFNLSFDILRILSLSNR